MTKYYQLKDGLDDSDIGILEVTGNDIDDEIVQEAVRGVYNRNTGLWDTYDELFEMIDCELEDEGWESERFFIDGVLLI